MEYEAINLDSNSTLATNVKLAGTSKSRRKGLLGTDSLSAGSAIWITPCEAIHTFGMRLAIDALFLDRDLRIRKLSANLQPWRLSVCLSATSVLELEAGTISHSGSRIGDHVRFKVIGSH